MHKTEPSNGDSGHLVEGDVLVQRKNMTQFCHPNIRQTFTQHKHKNPHAVEVETEPASSGNLDPVVGLTILPPGGIGEEGNVNNPVEKEIDDLS